MSEKPIIAVDIDDVIASNAESFVAYSNATFGTHLSVEDYHEHWSEMWGVDHPETLRRSDIFHESGHMGTYGAVDGALEALTELKEKFHLVVLTSRRSSMRKLTQEWVDMQYPGIFSDVVFTSFFDVPAAGNVDKTKAHLLREIGASYIIDDQVKHVLPAAEMGIPGLLFGNYPWNALPQLPENVTRVEDWNAVRVYFSRR